MIRAMLRLALVLAALVAATPLVALVAATPLLAGAFKASIERLPTDQGEPFELVLSLAGRDSLEPPNVTPLARDFEILDRRKRSRMETVAGQRVEVNEWVLTLVAKHPGRLTIPALSVGGEASAPIDLTIAPGAAMAPPDDEPLSLAVEVQGTAPFFLQSEIPVVVRMFDRVGALEATAGQPEAEGASFSPDGGLKTYSRVFGRQRFRVVELRYTMRPQRTGTIQIPSVALKASIPTSPPGAQEQARTLGRPAMPWLGGAFNAGRKITVYSNPVEVEVSPRPAGVTGWFLPARSVTLRESWSRPPGEAKVGGALVRTLRLEVKGASPGQLPPLVAPEVDGVRQYADEGKPEATSVDGGIGAVVETRVSVVPTRAGTVTLPAISVPWWNVVANRAETATLPAVTLTVAASATGSTPRAPAVPIAAPAPSPLADGSQGGWSGRDLMAALAVVVLVAGTVYYSGRRRRPAAAEPPPDPADFGAVRPLGAGRGRMAGRPALAPLDVEAAARALDAACRSNDAAAAHRAWLVFGRAMGGMGAPAPRTHEMARAVGDLSRHLYAGGAEGWDGRALRKALAAERRAARARNAGQARGLQPLYPTPR
ncbi:BatD family protein [Xanthobacter autotrophicus]|uniref:BatD family protein n=1 Tax=Xanthobacter autotrophicus TaxID=280 RepID=UPI0024A75BC9|nr:BatD family protein [Xanthobacter autotrophicus]MDI4658345.1 BatD family protein [Xanthobacter autotrophicus]